MKSEPGAHEGARGERQAESRSGVKLELSYKGKGGMNSEDVGDWEYQAEKKNIYKIL